MVAGRETDDIAWSAVRISFDRVFCMASAFAARAEEPFYQGKQLTLLINFAVGGPADVEGRLFAKYIGRHIAGNPSVLVQNMEGAGGVVGAKYLGAVAPKDGTHRRLLHRHRLHYALDPSRFDPAISKATNSSPSRAAPRSLTRAPTCRRA